MHWCWPMKISVHLQCIFEPSQTHLVPIEGLVRQAQLGGYCTYIGHTILISIPNILFLWHALHLHIPIRDIASSLFSVRYTACGVTALSRVHFPHAAPVAELLMSASHFGAECQSSSASGHQVCSASMCSTTEIRISILHPKIPMWWQQTHLVSNLHQSLHHQSPQLQFHQAQLVAHNTFFCKLGTGGIWVDKNMKVSA